MKFWSAILLACAGLALPASAGEPLTLDRAIQQALINNPDARIAGHRIRLAQAELRQANAAFWPRVSLSSSYVRTDNPMQVFGAVLNQRAYSPALDFNNVPDADNWNLRGSVTVPLYAGGQNAAGRQAARAGAEAAFEESAATHQALALEVARAFLTAQKALRFIEAAGTAVTALENNLEVARRRFENGALLKTEMLDVEVRLAQSREDLVRAENAHALALRALGNLLGLKNGEVAVNEAAPEISAPQSYERSERAELRAVEKHQRAAEADLRRAQSGYKPRISAFSQVDHDQGWRFNGSGQSYSAGVLLQWDLWDGRLTRGKVDAARARLDEAREAENKLRLAIDLETEQARLQWREAEERLAVTERTIALAAESAQLTRARFEQGLALASQLLDAETALTLARIRRAEAETDRLIAIAAWRKALALPLISHE